VKRLSVAAPGDDPMSEGGSCDCGARDDRFAPERSASADSALPWPSKARLSDDGDCRNYVMLWRLNNGQKMDFWERIKHAIEWRIKRIKKYTNGENNGKPQKKRRPIVIGNYKVIEEGLINLNFPIDIVYTWVDLDDPAFREQLATYLPSGSGANRPTMSEARFACHEELRYSLRSIERFAPWFNHIYIVTNGQVPAWLGAHPKVTLVTHDQILEPKYLPTFNSHVIGSALHRIPNLSEHYVYFNDDVLLIRPLAPTDAFTVGGIAYGFISANQIGKGRPASYETATEWGAKNARDLIRREWGFTFDRRFAHVFHPQRRSVAEDCERLFAVEYDRFRRNRFRRADDVLCCSFLHPYVGYITGRTLLTQNDGWRVEVRKKSALESYDRILVERERPEGLSVMCLNDGLPPDDALPDYEQALMCFLEACYPRPSAFERRGKATALAANLKAVGLRDPSRFVAEGATTLR
jgi:hypothetical protein